MVVLKLVQAMTRLALNPPEAFKDHVVEHLQRNSQRYFLATLPHIEVVLLPKISQFF